jgi:hypothetical protein
MLGGRRVAPTGGTRHSSLAWHLMVVIALVTPVIGTSVLMAPPASAEVCGLADGCHVYSAGYVYADATGLEGQWHPNDMYESASDYDAYGHINSEMWLGDPEGGYVEVGLLNGIACIKAIPGCGQLNGNPCACLAYQLFWAGTTDQGEQYEHWIANTSPTGANLVYEILNVPGTTDWCLYINYGNCLGPSTALSTSYGNYEQVGLEIAQGGGHRDIDPSSHADTFSNYIQIYAGGRWTYPPLSALRDHPCDTTGNPEGYCTNGLSYSSGEWSDNKP